MTLHMRTEYPINMPSFVPVHWLVFSLQMLMAKNKKMMTKPLVPSLYTMHYCA